VAIKTNPVKNMIVKTSDFDYWVQKEIKQVRPTRKGHYVCYSKQLVQFRIKFD